MPTNSKYSSRHSNKKITAAQFLAELVCENLASKQKTDLPNNFWNLPKWKKTFIRQVQLASGLLKIYDEFALIKVIRSNTKIFSLNPKFIDALFTKVENQQEWLAKTKINFKHPDINEKPRKPLQQKNLREKLDEL